MFARIDSTLVENFDIHEAILYTLKLVEGIYRKSEMQIKLEFNAKRPEVSGSIGKFQQILMNFLSNSAYALRHSTSKIIIIETLNSGPFVVLKFSDNGSGIPEENMDRIFEPFFTTKPPGEGTGLGLGITYGIVTEMKGTIEVSSKVGEGTTFTISLPTLEDN
jgi:two-component system NtrC family sensor kinase